MRAVVQRVQEASVWVEGRKVSADRPGAAGPARGGQGGRRSRGGVDGGQDRQPAHLRGRGGEDEPLARGTLGRLIVVSQFTLYGDARKGRRPSFIDACEPEEAKPPLRAHLQRLRGARARRSGTGVFAADMKVALVNDGPVTILLESYGVRDCVPALAAAGRPATLGGDGPVHWRPRRGSLHQRAQVADPARGGLPQPGEATGSVGGSRVRPSQ